MADTSTLTVLRTKYNRPIQPVDLKDRFAGAFRLDGRRRAPESVPTQFSIVRELHHTDEMVERDRLDHRSHVYAIVLGVHDWGTSTWLVVQHGGGTRWCSLDLLRVQEMVLFDTLAKLDEHDAFWLADMLMQAAEQSYRQGVEDRTRDVLKAKLDKTLGFPRSGGCIRLDLNYSTRGPRPKPT